jgi:hypothetical protein
MSETHDLTKLAADRACKAVESVTQLTDSDAVKYAIMVSTAANLILDASDLMAHYTELQHGKAPSKEAAFASVIKDILDAFGVDWRRKAPR